jgi:hypothetical protein
MYKPAQPARKNKLYTYTFATGGLEALGSGKNPDWKRCITDPDTGICSVPTP